MPRNWRLRYLTVALVLLASSLSRLPAADVLSPRIQPAARSPRALHTTDVALSSNQVLTGVVYDNTGIPAANAEVMISQGSREVARATTDQQGIFQIVLPHAGLYLISSGASVAIGRVWVRGTAPPNAVRSIVVEPRTIRSQSPLLGGPLPLFGAAPAGTTASASLATVAGLGSVAAAGVIFGPNIIDELKDKAASP